MPLIIGLILGIALDFGFMGWFLNVPVMWPTILFHVIFVALVVAAVSAISDKMSSRGYYFDPRTPTLIAGALAVLAVVLVIGIELLAGPTNATKLRDLGRVEVVQQRLEVADTQHIRVNPKESAEFLGNQVIGKGNLGSRFRVGEYDIQRNTGEIVWLAPLDFGGFFKWLSADYSPGYVIVSAEDITAAPRLVEGFKMRYTPSAYFNHSLHRHLYFNGFASFDQMETTFEADDNGKPYYVVSMTRPTVGFTGNVLQKIVVVDPETGDFQVYEPGKTPAWADRVFPEKLSKEYANHWGQYVHGFLNTIFGGNRDVMQISSAPSVDNVDVQDVFLVHNKETSNSNWICGMTSPSMDDKALTGYMTMDSITGAMKFYQIDSIGNEAAVIQAAKGAPEVAIQSSYRPAQPILYNIYGEDTWIVPILSGSNIPEKVAIVYGKDVRQVAVGNTKAEALDKYKMKLAELRVGGTVPTEAKDIKTVTGTVSRISAADSSGRRQLLLVEYSSQLFEVTRVISAEILVTNVGDKVKLTYFDTTEEVVTVRSFDNLGLDLVKSAPQKALEAKESAEASKTAAELAKEKDELKKQIENVDKLIEDTK